MNPVTATTSLDALRTEILDAVRSSSEPLMLFGSVARGDASPTSDVDVLELAERRRRPYRSGRVNISAYDRATLTKMAERGSLFVLHLRLEGKVLRDDSGELIACIEKYRRPTTYEPFRIALRQLANLLDVNEEKYDKNPRSYSDLALYLIRSEVYARLDEVGQPMFSLRAIATNDLVDPDVRRMLETKTEITDYQWFTRGRSIISKILVTQICNPYGSVEALVANAGTENPLVVAFGLRILGRKSFELSYDLLTAPPFA